MKKLLCLLLALFMTVSVALVACDNTPDDNSDVSDDLAFNPNQTTDAATTEAPVVTTEPVVYQFTECDEQVYVKNCLEVNLRSTPSSASKDNLKGSISFGDQKTYNRVLYNEVWSGLNIDGDIYYVNTEYLTTDDGFVVFDEVDKTIYAVNTTSSHGVKIYNFTDTDAEGAQYTTVKHNTPLHATGISKDKWWYRVNFTYTDKDGKEVTVKDVYIVNGKYVSDTPSEETAPVAE